MRHYIYDDNSGLVLGYDPLEPEETRETLEQYPATDAEEANRLMVKLYLMQEDSPLYKHLVSMERLYTRSPRSDHYHLRHQAYGAVIYHLEEHPEDYDKWTLLWDEHYRKVFGF